MKKNYLKIRLFMPQEDHDAAADDLLAFGFEGFEQHDDGLDAWISVDKFSEQAKIRLNQWLEEESGGSWRIMDEEILQERNWNEEWEKTIEPQSIGRFFIHPTWSDQTPPPDSIPITIDPKMAFGTGYHETTRLLLRFLPENVRSGDSVLDMGTGTGILAIAALRLGAGRAIGIDIDPWSYDNALENAILNDVADRLEIRIGSAEMIPEDVQFDLVLANINRNILLDLADVLSGCLASGGILMLSGILEGDVAAITGHPLYRTMELLGTSSENEWRALVYRK